MLEENEYIPMFTINGDFITEEEELELDDYAQYEAEDYDVWNENIDSD